jgi:hypothetical protein
MKKLRIGDLVEWHLNGNHIKGAVYFEPEDGCTKVTVLTHTINGFINNTVVDVNIELLNKLD